MPLTKKGNGVWIVRTSRKRLLWRGHDCLFVAFGRLRLRLFLGYR